MRVQNFLKYVRLLGKRYSFIIFNCARSALNISQPSHSLLFPFPTYLLPYLSTSLPTFPPFPFSPSLSFVVTLPLLLSFFPFFLFFPLFLPILLPLFLHLFLPLFPFLPIFLSLFLSLFSSLPLLLGL